MGKRWEGARQPAESTSSDGRRNPANASVEAGTIDSPVGILPAKSAEAENFCELSRYALWRFAARMFARPTAELRDELLALNGVGPETADSILLYAGNHPVFVVDAYTRRIFERHGIVSSAATYDEIRLLFEHALGGGMGPPNQSLDGASTVKAGPPGSCHPPSRVSRAERSALVQIFNEMHGLIVGVGKTYCLKSQPQCEQCPLQKFLPATK